MGAETRINLDGNEERSGGERPFQPGACVPVVMVVVMIVAVRVRVSVQTVLRNYFIAGHANIGPETAGDRRCLRLSGDRHRPKVDTAPVSIPERRFASSRISESGCGLFADREV